MHQLLNGPPRITERTLSVLDVFISTRSDLVAYTDVIPCQIAEHELLTMTVDMKRSKRQPVIKTWRDLTNYNLQLPCQYISAIQSTLWLVEFMVFFSHFSIDLPLSISWFIKKIKTKRFLQCIFSKISNQARCLPHCDKNCSFSVWPMFLPVAIVLGNEGTKV